MSVVLINNNYYFLSSNQQNNEDFAGDSCSCSGVELWWVKAAFLKCIVMYLNTFVFVNIMYLYNVYIYNVFVNIMYLNK